MKAAKHSASIGATKQNGVSSACNFSRLAIAPRSVLKPRQLLVTYAKCASTREHFSGNVALVLTKTDKESYPANEGNGELFNWFKHWWPVQLMYNLDTDRPNRIQLLGEFFVAWKGRSGEWVVMKDMCPHRLAPLSEGRVEKDGTLMCSYHGWKFDQSGKCVRIPQADDEKSHDFARNSPRSCVTSYPSQVRGGILWLWPDSSKTRFLDASVASIGLPDECADYLENRIREGCTPGFTGMVPYSYDVLVENIADPSHFPFSHHGSVPMVSRLGGGPVPMKSADSSESRSIAAVVYPSETGGNVALEIKDCSSVFYSSVDPVKNGNPDCTILFASPVEVDRSRIFITMAAREAPFEEKKGFSFFRLFETYGAWFYHLLCMNVLDGDNVFLHIQDAYLRTNDAKGWDREQYFTPAASDLIVVQFRKWLHSKGGGGPFGKIERTKKDLLPRRQLLDRYSSHVSECKVCQKTLRFVKRMITACKCSSLVSLVREDILLMHATQQNAVNESEMAAVSAAFVVSISMYYFLAKCFLPRFYFVDYIHAEKN